MTDSWGIVEPENVGGTVCDTSSHEAEVKELWVPDQHGKALCQEEKEGNKTSYNYHLHAAVSSFL